MNRDERIAFEQHVITKNLDFSKSLDFSLCTNEACRIAPHYENDETEMEFARWRLATKHLDHALLNKP